MIEAYKSDCLQEVGLEKEHSLFVFLLDCIEGIERAARKNALLRAESHGVSRIAEKRSNEPR